MNEPCGREAAGSMPAPPVVRACCPGPTRHARFSRQPNAWFQPFALAAGLLALACCGSLRAEFSEKVVERAKESTVRVMAKVGDDVSSGTGFVVSANGHVVTNYHVVRSGETVKVIYGRGESVFVKEAIMVVSEAAKDLVILKCESLPRTRPMALADRDTAGGQEVMALGFPGVLDEMIASHDGGLKETGRADEFTISGADSAGFVPVVFPGNVGKEMRIKSGFGGDFKSIAHSAKVSEGNSGGPLIDREGRLVGINVQGAGTKLGVDYAFAIHASELVVLARAHAVPIEVSSSKASSGFGTSGLQLMLWVVVAAFALVMFLLVLRKPRMVMAEAMSRVVHSGRQVPAKARSQPPVVSSNQRAEARGAGASSRGTMRLRGRDLHGLSYDVSFNDEDFRRAGGRLVIGRNPDLCQLPVTHDSVSRQHTSLTLQGAVVWVEDRNSGNGTRVNGRELTVGAAPLALQPGDRLTLGEVDLVFEIFN